MTDPERSQEPEASAGPATPLPEQPSDPATPAPHTPRASQGETPLDKGEPLDAERGPGLGCFWIQVIFLGVLLVLTPLTVVFAWPAEVSAVLLIVTLLLLLFAGQTVIFLLRLVAADRRSRRVPRSASARRTVGMIEDEAAEGTVPDDDAQPPMDGPAPEELSEEVSAPDELSEEVSAPEEAPAPEETPAPEEGSASGLSRDE